MRIMSLIALSAALAVAVPATAKTKSEAEQPVAGKSAEKKICKQLAASGTRMEKRVCLTKAEWKQVEEQK